jgi:hypothetical protein
MIVQKIIIHCAVVSKSAKVFSGTVCGRYVLTENTVTNPEEATCKVCLKSVTKKGKLEMCIGCEDNFYNGNNPYNIKECWNLGKAQIVSKEKIGINDVLPWKHTPTNVLSCRREKGYVFVGADREY